VEARATQREITALELNTGALVAAHRRSFAKHLTFTDPRSPATARPVAGHPPQRPQIEVELRSLDRYDALIPA
jgi:hypothetical protein